MGDGGKVLLEADYTRKAWWMMQKWYCHAKERPPPPTTEGLVKVTTDQEELYRQQSPEGGPTPFSVQLAVVPDGPPSEEDIPVVVHIIHAGRSGRTSGMQAEHMNMWLRETTG